jgi:hypothetical protein
MAFFKGNPVADWWTRYTGQYNKQEKPAVQTFPYKSDAVGFNTRFSRFDLEQREKFGQPLTADEEQFLCYVRALENVYTD